MIKKVSEHVLGSPSEGFDTTQNLPHSDSASSECLQRGTRSGCSMVARFYLFIATQIKWQTWGFGCTPTFHQSLVSKTHSKSYRKARFSLIPRPQQVSGDPPRSKHAWWVEFEPWFKTTWYEIKSQMCAYTLLSSFSGHFHFLLTVAHLCGVRLPPTLYSMPTMRTFAKICHIPEAWV